MRGYVRERTNGLSRDQQVVMEQRAHTITEQLATTNADDVQRIRVIDLRIRNIQSSAIMWAEIARDEVRDGKLENISDALMFITEQTDYLRQRVDEIRTMKKHLLDSSIPECKELHEIVERGFPLLEQYLETLTHVRELVYQLNGDASLATNGEQSSVYRNLDELMNTLRTQFDAVAEIGSLIQDNAAYFGYRKYLENNRLEHMRDEPINEEALRGIAAK